MDPLVDVGPTTQTTTTARMALVEHNSDAHLLVTKVLQLIVVQLQPPPLPWKAVDQGDHADRPLEVLRRLLLRTVETLTSMKDPHVDSGVLPLDVVVIILRGRDNILILISITVLVVLFAMDTTMLSKWIGHSPPRRMTKTRELPRVIRAVKCIVKPCRVGLFPPELFRLEP